MTVSSPWKCLCGFRGEAFCRIPWGSAFPTPMLENLSQYCGGREIKGNLYSFDKHMKHFAKSRQVCGKGRKLQNRVEYSAALKGSADTQIQLKGKMPFRMRACLWSNEAFCLHRGSVQLSYGSLKETKKPPSQMFEVCLVNLKVTYSCQCFPFDSLQASWKLN